MEATVLVELVNNASSLNLPDATSIGYTKPAGEHALPSIDRDMSILKEFVPLIPKLSDLSNKMQEHLHDTKQTGLEKDMAIYAQASDVSLQFQVSS